MRLSHEEDIQFFYKSSSYLTHLITKGHPTEHKGATGDHPRSMLQASGTILDASKTILESSESPTEAVHPDIHFFLKIISSYYHKLLLTYIGRAECTERLEFAATLPAFLE